MSTLNEVLVYRNAIECFNKNKFSIKILMLNEKLKFVGNKNFSFTFIFFFQINNYLNNLICFTI